MVGHSASDGRAWGERQRERGSERVGRFKRGVKARPIHEPIIMQAKRKQRSSVKEEVVKEREDKDTEPEQREQDKEYG